MTTRIERDACLKLRDAAGDVARLLVGEGERWTWHGADEQWKKMILTMINNLVNSSKST